MVVLMEETLRATLTQLPDLFIKVMDFIGTALAM
jgi:hypothetical protein